MKYTIYKSSTIMSENVLENEIIYSQEEIVDNIPKAAEDEEEYNLDKI